MKQIRNNSKYLIACLDDIKGPLVLTLPKMSRCVKAFKDKTKYKTNWIKVEDLKNIELNALPVCVNRSIKTKIRTYGDKVYTNFRDFSVPEDDVDCESFTRISIDSLLVYESKCYLKVYLDNCAHKM